MAFGKYVADVVASDVMEEMAARMGDLGAAMDSVQALLHSWDIVTAGGTRPDADVAQQLFGAQTQAELDKVADMKDAFAAARALRAVADGDTTQVIWSLGVEGKTFASAIVKFS